MDLISNLLNAARKKLTEADRAVGGWLPGGGVASPATRLLQQTTEVVRNPEKQLRNPKAFRALQDYLKPPTVVQPGGSFNYGGFRIGAPEKTTFYGSPQADTVVMVPEISTSDIFKYIDQPARTAYEIHFAGPEGSQTRAEARREYLSYGHGRKPSDTYYQIDPEQARARSLVLRAQLGQALNEIPENSWIRTGAAESPYGSRAKLYDRMTQGAFRLNPETNEILVYKAGPTTWYNSELPEKKVEWDPRSLQKQLGEEAIKKPSMGSLRDTPTGGVIEAVARRFGGPYAQAALLLDDAVKQITGVSPTDAILDASQEQMRRSVEQQRRMGVAQPRVWQNAPF
jgi:hypothetical protein